MELNKTKSGSGNISAKTLKRIVQDICSPLTGCINSATLNHVYKSCQLNKIRCDISSSDLDTKTNYQPTSIFKFSC